MYRILISFLCDKTLYELQYAKSGFACCMTEDPYRRVRNIIYWFTPAWEKKQLMWIDFVDMKHRNPDAGFFWLKSCMDCLTCKFPVHLFLRRNFVWTADILIWGVLYDKQVSHSPCIWKCMIYHRTYHHISQWSFFGSVLKWDIAVPQRFITFRSIFLTKTKPISNMSANQPCGKLNKIIAWISYCQMNAIA